MSSSPPCPPAVLDLVRDARHVVVLTGAGMSAESGIPTFRDAQTGLWEHHDPEQLATLHAWERDPEFVWAWYRWRAKLIRDVQPNAGHRALAAWAEDDRTDVWIVTQNVDDLHERAGSPVLAHLHGSIFALRCAECETPYDETDAPELALPSTPVERLEPPRCPRCGGFVRPGVVWFGEDLPRDAFAHAGAVVDTADVVLSIGTSGAVYPAAELPFRALQRGRPVVEINPGETEFSADATASWRTTAAVGLPALVTALGVGAGTDSRRGGRRR